MESSPKDIAVKFLTLVIAGKIDEAYERYVDMNGKHHNVFTAAGFAALRQGMKDNTAKSSRYGIAANPFPVTYKIPTGRYKSLFNISISV